MNLEEILSGRAGLAGVQRVLTGPLVRRQIHHAVRDLLAEGWIPGYLRLTRAKYKPGRKLNAYFNTPAYNKAHGKITTRPIAVNWRMGESKSASPDSLREAEAEIQQRGLAEPFQHLWSRSADNGMEVEISPLDPAFPQLARLSDPSYVQEQLEGRDGHGNRDPANYQVTPVRYRPGERHVLRYAADHQGETGVLYAKLYKNSEAAARAERIATRITDWLDARGGMLRGAHPYAVLLADAAILYPKIPGTPLSKLLQRPGEKVIRPLHEAGKGLFDLHAGPAALAADLTATPIEKEIHLIGRAAEHLQVLLPDEYNRIQSILGRAADLLASMPQEPLTFTHSDFKADHLLVKPGSLTLIDFDTCALADPALDVGKFLADLDYWYTMYGIPDASQAQAAFLEGYAPGSPDERLRRARVHHALILVKITVRRVRLFDRNWSEQTMQLLQKAEAVLNEVARQAKPIL